MRRTGPFNRRGLSPPRGERKINPIKVPPEERDFLFQNPPSPKVRSFSDKDGADSLPVFAEDIHKGHRGGVMIVGGSPHYRGAPILSMRGFLRAGGGVGVLFADESSCSPCAASLPEAIFENSLFTKSDREASETLELWKERIGCVVLGPGIGRSARAEEICNAVLAYWEGPIVLDGDGLFWLSQWDGFPRRENLILTPHEGEAAKLLCATPEDVRKNRAEGARRIALERGTVLLKGPETLCDNGADAFLVTSGNRALAVPGSGDVLSGIIGAFVSAGVPLLQSAALGAYVHGRAGRDLSHEKGLDGLLAGEIADRVPFVMKIMREAFP